LEGGKLSRLKGCPWGTRFELIARMAGTKEREKKVRGGNKMKEGRKKREGPSARKLSRSELEKIQLETCRKRGGHVHC